jgi:hypothetical protein
MWTVAVLPSMRRAAGVTHHGGGSPTGPMSGHLRSESPGRPRSRPKDTARLSASRRGGLRKFAKICDRFTCCTVTIGAVHLLHGDDCATNIRATDFRLRDSGEKALQAPICLPEFSASAPFQFLHGLSGIAYNVLSANGAIGQVAPVVRCAGMSAMTTCWVVASQK